MQKLASRMAPTGSRHYDTIVLGAGISGLAAASKLIEHSKYHGENKLLVLEARDRIGGRIGAVYVKGCRLDTGANWIHGIGTDEDPNPLVKILPHKKFKQLSRTVAFKLVEDSPGSHGESEDEWVHVDSVNTLKDTKGERFSSTVIPSEIAGKLMASLWSMIGSLGGTASQVPAEKAKKISMLEAIVASDDFQETYRSLPKDYHRTFGAMPQFIENMEAAPLVAESAEHTADSPGFSLLEFAIDEFDGDQVFLRDGYMAIVNEVAKQLFANQAIETSVEVKQIRHGNDIVEIITNGDTYTARNVICALPLGVLQHHQRSSVSTPFFQPALPDNKVEAIASLGFGTLDKIFLIYNHAWWTDEPYTSIWEKGMVHQPLQMDNPTSEDPTVRKSSTPIIHDLTS